MNNTRTLHVQREFSDCTYDIVASDTMITLSHGDATKNLSGSQSLAPES